MRKILSYLSGLPLLWRESIIRRIFFPVIKLPIVSAIYENFYYRVIREEALRGLRHIDIETYNLCNLKCKMCPYP